MHKAKTILIRPSFSSLQWLCGNMSASHCGVEKDGCLGLSLWGHYICIMLFGLCILSTLCVIN